MNRLAQVVGNPVDLILVLRSLMKGKLNSLLLMLTIRLIKIFCYILIIPGFGIISTVIASASNKNVFGYLGMVYARTAPGTLSPIAVSKSPRLSLPPFHIPSANTHVFACFCAL